MRDAVGLVIPFLCKALDTVDHENRQARGYILDCPVFQLPKNNYLNDFYFRNPNIDKFTLLFQSSNISVLSKLAKLCYEIIRRFR